MSRQATHLLEELEALPEEDTPVFTAEILRRALPFESGGLDDGETAPASGQLFALLDAEENESSSR